jgi:hypothetical protein
MKTLCLLLAIAVPLQSIHAQAEHAPTVTQCRADQRLWFSKLGTPDNLDVANVSFTELDDWRLEMGACFVVDPDLRPQYANTISEIYHTMFNRAEDFLARHDLFDEFITEDEKGCRGSNPCKPQGKR